MLCDGSCLHHHHLPSLHLDLQPATSIPIPHTVYIMYATPISRNIAGRHGGPLPSKSFADVLKLAANAYSKPASDPHYRVETSDQQLTHGVRISSTLLSNVGWESCTISTTTTFANEGDGSAVGEIHLGSYRHLMYPVYPGEVSRLDSQGDERS
jgi:hypothetical protein